MKLKDKRFQSYDAINLLKKFRHAPITKITVRGFYSDQPIFGKVAGRYKLMFEIFDNANVLSLRFYEQDIQRKYTAIAISKREVEIMKRVFEMAKNEN